MPFSICKELHGLVPNADSCSLLKPLGDCKYLLSHILILWTLGTLKILSIWLLFPKKSLDPLLTNLKWYDFKNYSKDFKSSSTKSAK